MVKRILILIGLMFTLSQFMTAQNNSGNSTDATPPAEVTEKAAKITAILPRSDSSVIFIEGEDAVATNFNREPILNYSCSGYRTIQLNQKTGLQNDSLYYADYVFYVEDDGVYEFWYGGTPPGNKNELLPSFSSPFRYTLDSFYQYDVYREDVAVAGGYAPAYYWNYVSDLTLSKGEHRITFEVPVRRSFDNKFFFYLDNFFLVKKENGVRILQGRLPEVFPENMDDRSMDNPFKSIEEYEIMIRDNPEEYRNYIEISMIYSLIGDYLNSLKNLRKALLLEPDDPDIMHLIAKNLIWKGSFQDGLYVFSDLLKIVPERVDYWAEAGKIAAWTGQYGTSIELFKKGIEIFEENLNLQANLGITYLWSGDPVAAEEQFKLVYGLAGEDLELNEELAEIFEVNGYPDKSIEIYRKLIKLYPENLGVRFLLEDAYIANNQGDKIEALRKETAELYEPSEEYEKVVQVFYNKQEMKGKVIRDYEEELDNDPDNLGLRKTLAEIYFWNGDKKRAINEYLNILTNYSYRNIRLSEKNAVQFYEAIDRNYALLHFINDVPAYLSGSMTELNESLTRYKRAVGSISAMEKKNKAMVEKGEEPDPAAMAALEAALETAENELASKIAGKESFIEKYHFIIDQFESDNEYLERLFTEEESGNEAFRKLVEGSSWEWDRDAMVKELEKVADNGLDLGGYVLGRIYQLEGSLRDASEFLDPLLDGRIILDGSPFAAFENALWRGDTEKRENLYNSYSEEILASGDYVFDLVDYLEYLKLEDDDIFGFLGDSPGESVSAVSKDFTEIKSELSGLRKRVQENIQNLHDILMEKTMQGFYSLAEETYLIRNELGDFYQNDKMFNEAIKQYRQVLAIDPWNLSAKFKLGLVYHWNGNWKKALGLYEEVYNEDPVYGNVTSFYNELARQHADSLSFRGSTFSDTSKLSFDSVGEYKRNINGIFSVDLKYVVNETTLFSGDSSSRVHSLSAALPLDLSIFTVSPVAGIYMVSNDGFTPADNPLEYFGQYDYLFKGGVSLSASAGSLSLDGSWLVDWEKDTLMQGAAPMGYSIGSAALQLDLGFIKKPVIKDSSMRLSGYGKYMDDNNLIWGGFYELINSNLINSDPDVILDLKGSFSYEDSAKTGGSYWSPDRVLNAGGGIELFTSFKAGGESFLKNRVRVAAGYYLDGENSGSSFEIGNLFEFERKEFTGYFQISTTFKNQKLPVSDPFNYWSLSFSFGGKANLPDLLSL